MTSHVALEISSQIEASIRLKQSILNDADILKQMEKLIGASVESLRAGGKVIFAGNGGSFADAQHLSAEFTSRFQLDRTPFSSLVLASNNSAISAIGNDYGYDQIFARELLAIARLEDIYIPLTTSGNSPNILRSIEVAQNIGLKTVCLTGLTGGRAREICDCICIPSSDTARIQECHIMLGHILCGSVEKMMLGGNGLQAVEAVV